MEFFDVIKNRHCARSFNPDKSVPEEDVKKILDAGKRAPSAGGIYPVKFFVVKDAGTRKNLAMAALNQDFIAEAPVAIIVCVDIEKTAEKYGKRGRELYAIQDSAVAAENIFLAATALNLDCCWVGAFDENEVRHIADIPKNLTPMAILPIGYQR